MRSSKAGTEGTYPEGHVNIDTEQWLAIQNDTLYVTAWILVSRLLTKVPKHGMTRGSGGFVPGWLLYGDEDDEASEFIAVKRGTTWSSVLRDVGISQRR